MTLDPPRGADGSMFQPTGYAAGEKTLLAFYGYVSVMEQIGVAAQVHGISEGCRAEAAGREDVRGSRSVTENLLDLLVRDQGRKQNSI